jgi:hypothetical protein
VLFFVAGLAQAYGAPPVTMVERDGEVYRVAVDARIRAPVARVRALLTDYAHLDRLNEAIVSSEVMDDYGAGRYRVRIVTRACIWFFCRTVHQVQDVVESGESTIKVRVIPELSDFRQGSARFFVRRDGEGARVNIVSEVEPDFWIPPLIGPWLIKRKLLSEALETVKNLEARGRGATSRGLSAHLLADA